MTESMDLVIERFPYSTIEKIDGEPNYHTIKEVERKLNKNASSYQMELGRGYYGYLSLVLSLTKYNLVTRSNFMPHPNPGSMPTFPSNTT